MQLFVIRHSIAEDTAPGGADADRALTEDGKVRLRKVVRGLAALDVPLERVLTSPWRRAAETARRVAKLAGTQPIVTELLTQSPRAELLALIAESPEATAVVGHEPWLGELVAWLAFGDTKHGDALAIKKAGVAWLEGSAVPGGMQLRALLPPGVLRSIR